MKKINILLVLLAMVVLSGCSVITGIFKAGVFVGILAVVVVVGIIIWIFSMLFGGGK
ncbi:lipoprotein [Mucilaginibacter sp. dw_454]|uniref:lipoprotein n=1 Tax=Mucilaginibacter sp. dw_454 TaxID=2720079 RepID=UPI001BD64CEE|nr:lipoprotein [Mucilaginibacter sp. dw_454]